MYAPSARENAAPRAARGLGIVPPLTAQVRVLLGDSSPSQLPPNILDTLIEVCLYARDVSLAHEETVALWAELDAAEHSFADIAEQLQRFRRVGESGLLAAVKEASRDEMKQHGQQAVEALGRQVQGWLGQYEATRDKQVGALRQKIDALHQQMLASLDRFALPLRGQPTKRVLRRTLEEGKAHYLDVATLELLPGLRAELQLEDSETEQPRRLKSLVGKGRTLQVGTKKALIRRTEEPAHVNLDDLLIVAAQISRESVRLELAKKVAGPVTLRVGLGLSGEMVVGRGELPDGSGNALPTEDRETVRALWDAMRAEAERIIASPARSLGYVLRDEPVETPAGFVNVAERIVQTYRPIIAEIMAHSPNDQELTIKVELADRGGERREEKWIERKALAEHLSRVPEAFSTRLAVPEVFGTKALPRAAASLPREPVVDADLDDLATRAYAAIPVEAAPEHTDDISLTDLSLTDLEIAGESTGEIAGEIIVKDGPPPPPGAQPHEQKKG